MRVEKRRQIIEKAMDVFQRHGYRRVNMKEIAESLEISRPGLYLYFKTKEEVFNAVIEEFGDRSLERAQANAGAKKRLKAKLQTAFESYVVEIFELTLSSPEAREISDSSLTFAREALEETYRNFERFVARLLKENRSELKTKLPYPAETCAHLLVSSVRGFKVVAKSSAELRKMIQQLLQMTLRFPQD